MERLKKRFRNGWDKVFMRILFTIVKHNRKEEKRQEKGSRKASFYNIGAKIRKIGAS